VEELNQRHKTLEEFFLLIGAAPEEAFQEAEKPEHQPEVSAPNSQAQRGT
jgi:Mn-dependent DtxR family transcriptional regulator